MKMKYTFIVLLILPLLFSSCRHAAEPENNDSHQDSDVSLTQEDVPTRIPPTVSSELPPDHPLLLKFSTASMPKKYRYIPQGSDRRDAEALAKREDTIVYKINVSADTAIMVYAVPLDRRDMQWVHTMRETHDINEVVKLCDKRIYFFHTIEDPKASGYYGIPIYVLNKLTGDDYVFWGDAFSISDSYPYFKAVSQLLNAEAFEQLKSELNEAFGIKEIREIICFKDHCDTEFFYYSTDKGEFVFTNFCRREEYSFVSLDEFVEWCYAERN